MKQSKSNNFAIHILHGHIYKFICNVAFFAFQSSLSLRYRFLLCASRFCASHFVSLFWDRGWSQGTGACTTGLGMPPCLLCFCETKQNQCYLTNEKKQSNLGVRSQAAPLASSVTSWHSLSSLQRWKADPIFTRVLLIALSNTVFNTSGAVRIL